MSIELPEAKILAEQMNKELQGKCIKSCHLQDYEKLQRIGMLNKDIKDFDQLVGAEIEFVKSRGNVICMKLTNGSSLILALSTVAKSSITQAGKRFQKSST